MTIDLKVPSVGESITDVQIVGWLKNAGDPVSMDEPVVVIETDKATLEVPSPASGILSDVMKPNGEWAKVGEVIAHLIESAEAPVKATTPQLKPKLKEVRREAPAEAKKPEDPKAAPEKKELKADSDPLVMPAARRAMAENEISKETVKGTGPGGRVLKEDVMRLVQEKKPQMEVHEGTRAEEIVPMSPLRRTVAHRLVEVQQTAALLTTFNEVDMSAVMTLRKQFGEAFKERHGAKLGIMSFFVKAVIDALRQVPQVNAQIRGESVVYHNYQDIGIAVGGGKGLVVPVLRNAERMSFAEVEKAISDFSARAAENKLALDELQGGTFTISNGGIYGSMLSTPIVNPPQSGILGLHAIQDRPVARDGQVVIRPMMYVALTYDHRLIDGREAVTFLRRVKEAIEDPPRILLEI